MNLKRNATNPVSLSSNTSTKRQRRSVRKSGEDADQAHIIPSPGSSNIKLDKTPSKRGSRRAAAAPRSRTKASSVSEDESSDDGEHSDFEDQESDAEDIEEEEEAVEDSDDDFEEDFRTKKNRSTSATTSKKRSASKTAQPTTITNTSLSNNNKKKPAAMTPDQKTALAKAMSKFKVSKVKIPHPKGGPVADAIQPETLEFIRDLKLNNDREYMMLNQERCDKAKADFVDFIRMVKDGLREADDDVMDQEPKDSMMRIYRDIRFSNDKSPYKSQLAAFFSRGGKKSIAAGYYFSVSSENKSFVGCGVWDASSAVLTRIRNGIAEEEERFREILQSDAIKDITKGKTGINALSQRNKLKTGPKGFDKNHSAIEFLKLKSFAIGRYFTDLEVVSPGFLEEVLKTFDACVEFVHILNEWIG